MLGIAGNHGDQLSTAGVTRPRVRVEIATVATTAAANVTICQVMVSPLKAAASAKVTKGCSNCTCDTYTFLGCVDSAP